MEQPLSSLEPARFVVRDEMWDLAQLDGVHGFVGECRERLLRR